MTPKEEFTALYQAHITRPGADKLLAFLEKSDFFLAPASTRFHLACRERILLLLRRWMGERLPGTNPNVRRT